MEVKKGSEKQNNRGARFLKNLLSRETGNFIDRENADRPTRKKEEDASSIQAKILKLKGEMDKLSDRIQKLVEEKARNTIEYAPVKAEEKNSKLQKKIDKLIESQSNYARIRDGLVDKYEKQLKIESNN